MESLRNAINNNQLVVFYYEGKRREVEPYLIGENAKRNILLRAYQIGGYSSSKIPAWKLFKIDRISNVQVLESKFKIRSEYNRNDKHMTTIIERI